MVLSCLRRRASHKRQPLFPPLQPALDFTPSLVRQDASSPTVCDLGARVAAPEDNRERWEPRPRRGGDKPSRPEQRVPPLAASSPPALAGMPKVSIAGTSPAERAVRGERGGSHAAKRGAGRLPILAQRRRPFGAPPVLTFAGGTRNRQSPDAAMRCGSVIVRA